MSQKTNKHAKFHNALSLFTLLFLLGTISFTLSQAMQRQTTNSRGQVQGENIGTVSPTYWIGEGPETNNPTVMEEPTIYVPEEEFITPTMYCLAGVPCTSPEPTLIPIGDPEPTTDTYITESPEPTEDPCAIAQNSIQTTPDKSNKKQNKGFVDGFFDWFSQFIDKLVFRNDTQPDQEPEPTTQPDAEPTEDPYVEPTIDPCAITPPVEEPTTDPNTTESPEPTVDPITTESPDPTVDPCATEETSIQSTTPNKNYKSNKKQNEGFINRFFDWFSQFMDKLVFRNNTQPDEEPEPSIEPTTQPDAEPTEDPYVEPTIDPCAITPPVEEPTTDPNTTESPEPTVDPITTESPDPTTDPCIIQNGDETASIQHHPNKKHRKSYNNGNNGWFSQIFRFLLDLIEALLRMLGLQNPNPNPDPDPTPPDPCLTVYPTQPIDPTAIPLTDPTTQPDVTLSPTNPTQLTDIPLAPTGDGGNGGGGGTVGGEQKSVKITFYGSYDNDPKGSLAISDPVIHQEAGGIGTFEDPLSFASPDGDGAYEVGAKIYVPLVQKYFIKEDTCAVSWTAPDGCGDVDMVDLYVGNPSSDEAVVECENALTPSGDTQIILNPPSGLTYDPTPIWNQNTGACMTPHN